ncbi:MAG: hypothetical protein ABIY55_32720 [Kofleriaceae bacterium]
MRTAGAPESPYDPSAPTSTSPATKPASAPGFGHAGASELGVAFGATIASDVRDLSATLAFGRFVAERFELSAIASIANVQAGAQSATLWSSLLEPAYHVVLSPSIVGVLGMGVGAAYTRRRGTGLTVAPRIGVRFAVGDRGVFTPALSYTYVTHRALDPIAELADDAVTRALRIQLGYAITW